MNKAIGSILTGVGLSCLTLATCAATARKEVFLQGLKLGGVVYHGGNGISVDATSRLYVASASGGEIVILNR
jgi:hypothetical protein